MLRKRNIYFNILKWVYVIFLLCTFVGVNIILLFEESTQKMLLKKASFYRVWKYFFEHFHLAEQFQHQPTGTTQNWCNLQTKGEIKKIECLLKVASKRIIFQLLRERCLNNLLPRSVSFLSRLFFLKLIFSIPFTFQKKIIIVMRRLFLIPFSYLIIECFILGSSTNDVTLLGEEWGIWFCDLSKNHVFYHSNSFYPLRSPRMVHT